MKSLTVKAFQNLWKLISYPPIQKSTCHFQLEDCDLLIAFNFLVHLWTAWCNVLPMMVLNTLCILLHISQGALSFTKKVYSHMNILLDLKFLLKQNCLQLLSFTAP